MGHGRMLDHMFLDGLEDAYDRGRLMGTYAEDCAQSHGFSREQQDAWALQSVQRAQTAIEQGLFGEELAPVSARVGRRSVQMQVDETPLKVDPSRIRSLKPAFAEGGTVTAANSSSISDGAAALVLMRDSEARRRICARWQRFAGMRPSRMNPVCFQWRRWVPSASCWSALAGHWT